MHTDPTRPSALSVALLAHTDSGYEVDCWLADTGQPHGSVRYDTAPGLVHHPGPPGRPT